MMRYDSMNFERGVFGGWICAPRICGEWVMFTDIYALLFTYETTIIRTIISIVVSSVIASNSQKSLVVLSPMLTPVPLYHLYEAPFMACEESTGPGLNRPI